MLRFFLFTILSFCTFVGAHYFAAAIFLYYLFRYTGPELVVLALLVDGYVGAFYSVPWISLGVASAWFLTTIIKQRLLLYTDTHEVVS